MTKLSWLVFGKQILLVFYIAIVPFILIGFGAFIAQRLLVAHHNKKATL